MLFKELEARFTTNWTQKLTRPFNCLAVDSIFKHPGLSLAVAGEDGKVYVYEISTFDKIKSSSSNLSNPLKLLSEHETKGDALQAMVVHDVTKVHANDLITCDSRGLLTVFCNGQILSRRSLSNESLDCLQVSQELDGSVTIVAGGDAGLVTGVHPSKELWRLNLLQTPSFGPVSSSAVSCISSFDLPSSSSDSLATYVFVADNASRLHVLHQGKIVLAMQTPSIVNAMTAGIFVTFEEGGSRSSTSSFHAPFAEAKSSPVQIALGCENGAIYIVENFEIIRHPYAKGDHSINKLSTIPVVSNSSLAVSSSSGTTAGGRRRSSSSGVGRHSGTGSQTPSSAIITPAARIHDALIVAGNFNQIHLYHAGKMVASTPTSDWVCSLAHFNASKDKHFGLMVGCLDRTVSSVEISF